MHEYNISISNLNTQEIKNLFNFLVNKKGEKMYYRTKEALSKGDKGCHLYLFYDEREGWVRGGSSSSSSSSKQKITIQELYRKFGINKNRID